MLSDINLEEIKEMKKQGLRDQDIASHYGVTTVTLRRQVATLKEKKRKEMRERGDI